RNYLEYLGISDIYKTNYYDYPLTLNINITNINFIYSTIFGLINNIRVNSVIQLINTFEKLYGKERLIKLNFVITNFNNKLKIVLIIVFHNVQ
ncbi:hypothetical protein QR685DRAFT_451836, partial [Neurospora intermedia]